jgi:hypothetical protein
MANRHKPQTMGSNPERTAETDLDNGLLTEPCRLGTPNAAVGRLGLILAVVKISIAQDYLLFLGLLDFQLPCGV